MSSKLDHLFTDDVLAALLPADRADQFFDALLGDASEGAYDIKLTFRKHDPAQKNLLFDLELHERPGKCLACNLTYGLPEVFSRHPVINIKGLVEAVGKHLDSAAAIKGWRLGATHSVSKSLHTVPLTINLD